MRLPNTERSGFNAERISVCREGSEKIPLPAWARENPWQDSFLIPCADGKARRIKPGLEPLVDGISNCLADVLSYHKKTWKEITDYAKTTSTDPHQILRILRERIQQETTREESTDRGYRSFYAPSLLLDLLLSAEATCDRTSINSFSKEQGQEVVDRAMRSMRSDYGSLRSSRRWQPYEQQLQKPPTTMQELSCILACHAEAYWKAVYRAHASINRVSLLRGYGNAISPQVAARFIQASEEARRELS